MAECKRKRVPQISVEAVDKKPAMKRHATKMLMLDLEVTGHRDRFYKTTEICELGLESNYCYIYRFCLCFAMLTKELPAMDSTWVINTGLL